MGLDNQQTTTTITAGADLSLCQYLAVAMDDGLVAAAAASTAADAIGVLMNKPKASGEAATVAWAGECRFKAGAAVAKGAYMMVTTSGWFITATSGSPSVGRCKSAVTSGSIGTGLFNFATTRTHA